jgi:hypothetical protein
MAIVVETVVPHGPRAQAERFDAAIESAMAERGGPPDGLMVHLTRPRGEGFVLINVWRSEAEMRPYYDDVVLPQLASAGLEPEESEVFPVWTFARP